MPQMTDAAQCYLCPGNERAAGDRNPKYEKTFAFVNDYSAVKEQQPDYNGESSDGTRLDSSGYRDGTAPANPPQISNRSFSALAA